MAPAARPSSPTSLLWAHQLKNEHGHLLKRMQDLESANQKQEHRIKAVESAADRTANSDFAALAEKVRVLDQGGFDQRLRGMERDVERGFDDVQAGTEAVSIQLSALQRDGEVGRVEERKRNVEQETVLLRRIGEVEEGLRKYERSLDLMGRRINGDQFELIKEQLGGLDRQVRGEGEGMKMLGESVAALEAANEELRRANGRLEGDLRRVAVAKSRPAVSVESDSARVKASKKSHKWAGGGADRGIIRRGSGLVESSLMSNPDPTPSGARISSKKKSHKWAGGGADKDIIQAGSSSRKVKAKGPMPQAKKPQPVQLKRKAFANDDNDDSIKTTLPFKNNPQPPQLKRKAPAHNDKDKISTPRPQKKHKTSHKWSGGGADKEILRAGKGWYEVACSPSRDNSETSSLPPKKRGPGRPRKVPTPQWTQDEAFAQGRTTRRRILQPSQMQEPAGKRRRKKVDASTDGASSQADPRLLSHSPLIPSMMSASRSATPEMKKHLEPSIFSSPVSSSGSSSGMIIPSMSLSPSPPPLADYTIGTLEEVQVVRSDVANSQPEQAPLKRRREIVQVDDMSLIVRQMSG